MANEVIEKAECATAEELLAHLSPFSDEWRLGGGINRWVFRGQAGEWPLDPSAMRAGALVYRWRSLAAEYLAPTLKDQLKFEMGLVMDFAHRCIRAGIALPEDSQWLRSSTLQKAVFDQKRMDLSITSGVDAPFPLLRSLFALAQHHLIPTRLLDWTADPLIASYFACEYVARSKKDPEQFPPKDTPSDRLVVWALRIGAAEQQLREWHERNRTFEPLFECVEAPYRDNPRLAAQRGAFSLVVYKTARQPDEVRLPTLEDVLRSYGMAKAATPDRYDDWPLARAFSLPHAQARRLFRMLGEADINASTVFRDYDGARLAAEEQTYWAEAL